MALVATLTTNYIVRGHLDTKVVVESEKPIYPFYLQDSLFVDSLKTPLIKNWNYYGYKAVNFIKNDKDSINKQTPVTMVFYTKKDDMFIGIFKKVDTQAYYSFDDVYIVPTDTGAFPCLTINELVYDIPKNSENWLTGFSMPRITTATILHVPQREYDMIPDSLIRKLPF